MDYKEIDNEYISLIKSDEERYIKDYKEIMKEVKVSKARFRGEVVPYSYKPLFWTNEDVENFKVIGTRMLKIGDKVVDEYLRNPKYREKFKFSKELEELILIDNGYDINVPMSRIDIFYKNEDEFKFCEINTDGSSAMLEDNEFGRITLETKGIKDLEDKYNFHNFELMESWVHKSLEIYDNWDNEEKNDLPNVAILDFRESATSYEFEEFKKIYEEKGIKTKIVDPRDLKYVDGNLYKGDFRIDMIYRRLVTFEMMERFDEVTEFVKAYKDKAVCVIGSLRSQLLHNKIIFKVLHDCETLKFMNKEEQEFIKNHIPWTGDFGGDEELLERVKSKKDEYIMKPWDMNVAKGVFVGRDMSQEEWETRLDEVWNEKYICQEFVTPYYREFVKIEESEIKIEKLNSVLGIFMYGEEFKGLYTRIGKENVISSVNSHRAANLIVSL